MNKEELQKLIDQLEVLNLEDEATFGIMQYGGGPDESFIRANKQGLIVFATQLLKAAKDSDEIIADELRTIIPLNTNHEWIDEKSDIIIEYIEPITGKHNTTLEIKRKEPIIDKLIPI